ncbi:MAG: hypothetical protein QW165_03405 [Candidatus Woesearchaeota archaeon]
MKKLLPLFLLLMGCTAQTQQDAMHTMDNHDAVMRLHAGGNKTISAHDFTVNFEHSEIKAGEPATLVFTVMRDTKPAPLIEHHGAPMHVIIVSKDLSEFYHAHPKETAPSTLMATQTFEKPGDYRIWIDFITVQGNHIIDFDVNVENGNNE